jgi:prepilin-type N-terminal cleavage/methylation domain-containing protein
MKRLHKDQRGFSLIELLIVIVLTGLITAAITTTIFQVFNMNTRTSNRMTAVSQVLNAGKIVSEDILEAQIVAPGTSSGFPLALNWTDVGTSDAHGVVYTLEGPSTGPNMLWRKDYLNSAPNSTTKIAEYIDVSIDPVTGKARTNCVWAGGVLTFTVTATVGKESETRVYEVKPRPGS